MMDVYTFSVHKVGLNISGIIAQMLFSIEKDQASESQLLVMLMVTETLKSSFQKRISFMSWHMLVSSMTFWIQELFPVFIISLFRHREARRRRTSGRKSSRPWTYNANEHCCHYSFLFGTNVFISTNQNLTFSIKQIFNTTNQNSQATNKTCTFHSPSYLVLKKTASTNSQNRQSPS